MIRVSRGLPDSDGAETLAAVEARALAALRPLYAAATNTHPTGRDLEGFDYRVAGPLLWKRQGRQCAYCEHPEQRRRNDVEHFRPKSRADRGAGFPTYGYWWLAWRWQNLLFACRNCNQSLKDSKGSRGKLDRFPLEPTSGVLVPEQDPYGADSAVEEALLIDPGAESPIEHIEFQRVSLPGGSFQWIPVPKNGSKRGEATIFVMALDRDDLLEAYNAHVTREVEPDATRFLSLPLGTTDADRRALWESIEVRLYRLGSSFRALSYDALRVLVPDASLGAIARREPPL